MMEQSHTGKCHCHAVFVAALNHKVITDGAARLGNILDAGFLGAFDIIAEREEGVRAQRNAVDGIKIRPLRSD